MSPLSANKSNTLFMNPPFRMMNDIVGGKAHPINKNI
jgi:hypothetical protein